MGAMLAALGCQPSGSGSDREVDARQERIGQVRDTPTPTRSPLPVLLPNLASHPAENVHLRVTGKGRELRFAGVLANVGAAPLIVAPSGRPGCPRGQHHVVQAIVVDTNGDGAYTERADRRRTRRDAGCMVYHPTHRHWHFDAMASYVLTRRAETVPLVAEDKVSFCLRDSRRVPGAEWADVQRRYGRCKRDRIQAISAGWADVYKSSLPGQALPLPADLPDGTYCLRTTADPLDLLEELREDDNAAVVGVRIRQDRADVVDAAACG
jgi:Lysyl oxidase